MVTCRDILSLDLDGCQLIAGESGLDRMVSWTYMVQTRPYDEHMNQGNFALIVVDNVRYDMQEALVAMKELNELGISGYAISVVEDRENIPLDIIETANKLSLPLFSVRWTGASFVDIAQSIGSLIIEDNFQNKRSGDYLYNLLFGYDINERYVKKIAGQFGLDFSKPYRVGIVVVDRIYGVNLEQDEHIYEYYANNLQRAVINIEGKPMFMKFLNKFVLMFEAKKDKSIEHQIEKMLRELDSMEQFEGKISSMCILGGAYNDPRDLSKSYQEAKSLIPKKDILPNPKRKKVLSARAMGIYKYMFTSGNHDEILNYCNDRLRPLEEYDHANGTYLQETLVAYYMNGFSIGNAAAELYIHRNSMQYRLAKIEELLGIERDDYVEYLELVNCVMIKRLMFT